MLSSLLKFNKDFALLSESSLIVSSELFLVFPAFTTYRQSQKQKTILKSNKN